MARRGWPAPNRLLAEPDGGAVACPADVDNAIDRRHPDHQAGMAPATWA